MKTPDQEIFNGEYMISCKYYIPDTEQCDGEILVVHGFAGDKESSALHAAVVQVL